MIIISKKLPLSDTISFECCEFPMKIRDETISEFEISNNNRVSINIYQVHEKELEYYYNTELDSSDDVSNRNNDLICTYILY